MGVSNPGLVFFMEESFLPKVMLGFLHPLRLCFQSPVSQHLKHKVKTMNQEQKRIHLNPF